MRGLGADSETREPTLPAIKAKWSLAFRTSAIWKWAAIRRCRAARGSPPKADGDGRSGASGRSQQEALYLGIDDVRVGDRTHVTESRKLDVRHVGQRQHQASCDTVCRRRRA